MATERRNAVADVMEQCIANHDQCGGAVKDDAVNHPIDWLGYIDKQMGSAAYGVSEELNGTHAHGEYRARMVKVAALAIQAVESYDRIAAIVADAPHG